MAVTLLRAYSGYPQGQVVELTANEEVSLIAQGLASTSLITAITTGAVTCTRTSGVVAIPAGSSSVVITNPLINANTSVFAVVAQATADATLLRIERIVTAAGSVTLYGTANATATTLVDWSIVGASGLTQQISTT